MRNLRHHTIPSYKKYLLVALLSSCSVMSYAAEPINSTLSSTDASASLPNAYELVQMLESQKREMARLANQIESLELQISELKKTNPSINNSATNLVNDETLSQQSLEILKTQLKPDIERIVTDEVTSQVNSKLDAIQANRAPSRPYLVAPTRDSNGNSREPILLTNIDIPDSTFNTPENSLAVTTADNNSANDLGIKNNSSSSRQGELAYAAAYAALKNEGVDAGIEQMQTFIATYAHHDLVPDAHYWLGEFYLKQTPPNVALAEDEFDKVVTLFKDNPNNTKQSKALYRLATFAKSKNDVANARKYANQLMQDYPESKEAKLAKDSKW